MELQGSLDADGLKAFVEVPRLNQFVGFFGFGFLEGDPLDMKFEGIHGFNVFVGKVLRVNKIRSYIYIYIEGLRVNKNTFENLRLEGALMGSST